MWSHSLFRDTPVPLMVVQPDGLIEMANPAAARLFARQSLSGRSLTELVGADDRHRLVAELTRWRTLAGGGSATSPELAVLCADGPRRGHLHGSRGLGERGATLFVAIEVPHGPDRAPDLDSLTGVATRPHLLGLLAEHVSPDALGCVLLVDLDELQGFNRRFGMAAGDRVLVEVASRLLRAVPVGAAVARWDGDAFLVLVPGAPAAHAMELARTLLRALCEPMEVEGTRVVTSSIGVARLAGSDVDDVFRRVDWALSSAKDGGGRQIADDSPAPRHFGRRRSDLEEQIAVWRSSAQGARKELERAWAEARTDALTGLPNKRAWEDRVAGWPDQGRRARSVAVAFVDLDDFGVVNKQWGQEAGDLVLKSIAELLGSGCRAEDTVYRPGGEEFVIVLPDTDETGARVVAERMRSAVEAAALRHPTRGICTVSVGVAAEYGSEVDLRSVANRANEQEKRAKQAGKNRVFPPSPPS